MQNNLKCSTATTATKISITVQLKSKTSAIQQPTATPTERHKNQLKVTGNSSSNNNYKKVKYFNNHRAAAKIVSLQRNYKGPQNQTELAYAEQNF